VEVNFLNYGHRPHTYKFALQLYQGETFVKQLDFSDREYPTNSHEYWKCTFNNLDFTGVPDGTYRIVPASKAEGYAVTVPCENSDANYVEATLKDNTLTLTRHPKTAGGDFAVSGVTIDGKLVAGRKVPIRFTATNNGTGGSELPLSVELGFSNTETTVYVDPGQSEEVTVWITPSMPINDYYEQELMIVNSNDGTDLYYDTVTLTDPVTSSLSAGNITVSNSNGSSVSGTTLDFTVELKNRMSKAYDDYVIAVLYGVNNGTYVSQQTLYKPVTVKYGFLESFPAGASYGVGVLKGYVEDLKYLFSADGAKSLGGFGAIGSLFPATWDWYMFWKMLAFMNILPIPVLDGGHVLFLLYEIITRRKPSETFMIRAEYAGFAILILLMVVANLNDILRWLGYL